MSNGLTVPSLSEFSTVVVIHIVKGSGIVNKAEIDVFLELSCFFNDPMDLAIWSLVFLPFPKPTWASVSSWFMYYWSLAWRILRITLLVCEMSAIMWYFEQSLALPFFGIGINWPFPVLWPLLSFPNLLAYLSNIFLAMSLPRCLMVKNLPAMQEIQEMWIRSLS